MVYVLSPSSSSTTTTTTTSNTSTKAFPTRHSSGILLTLPAPCPVIRKRSGEPVKSSFRSHSKSAPSTPHPSGMLDKSVSFPSRVAEMERVLFYSTTSRPREVSNSGSPSVSAGEETEEDAFPFPAFKGAAGGVMEKSVVAVLANGAKFKQNVEGYENVFLESMSMDPSMNLVGRIVVRNISFQKWVAIRFTLDNWQTVSEVSATHSAHVDMLPQPLRSTCSHDVASAYGLGWDLFTFSIKLSDLISSLDRKLLLLAVRYNVTDNVYWDSNGDSNYTVRLEVTNPPTPHIRRRAKSEAVSPSALSPAFIPSQLYSPTRQVSPDLIPMARPSVTGPKSATYSFAAEKSPATSSAPMGIPFPCMSPVGEHVPLADQQQQRPASAAKDEEMKRIQAVKEHALLNLIDDKAMRRPSWNAGRRTRSHRRSANEVNEIWEEMYPIDKPKPKSKEISAISESQSRPAFSSLPTPPVSQSPSPSESPAYFESPDISSSSLTDSNESPATMQQQHPFSSASSYQDFLARFCFFNSSSVDSGSPIASPNCMFKSEPSFMHSQPGASSLPNSAIGSNNSSFGGSPKTFKGLNASPSLEMSFDWTRTANATSALALDSNCRDSQSGTATPVNGMVSAV